MAGIVVGGLLVALCGCDSGGLEGLVQVRGKVLFNDQPLTGGTIVYLPAAGTGGRQAQGLIGSDGTFELSSLKPGDGAQKGKYDIIIIAREQAAEQPKSRVELEATGGPKTGRLLIPEKYANPDTSGLSDTVDDNHSGYVEFKLSDK